MDKKDGRTMHGDRMECPRCKGKGYVEERRWKYIPGPNGLMVKKWIPEDRYRCPICQGDGSVPDPSKDGRFSRNYGSEAYLMKGYKR